LFLLAHQLTSGEIIPDVDYEISWHPDSAPRSWGETWAEVIEMTKLLAHHLKR
jgi:hypothetical protein